MTDAFPFAEAECEEIPCNLCGSLTAETVSMRDRNDLAVRSAICTHCGLVYLSPRMTSSWYARYYVHEYRQQMARFHGSNSQPDLEYAFARQQRHGERLATYLESRGAERPTSILDIGSSTGGTLDALRRRYGADVFGIEPGTREADYANSRGVSTDVGLFEEYRFPAERAYDLVICVLTFNHLLDPRGTARHVAELLTPNGLFLVECADFFELCRYWGGRDKGIQIDHTYMFVPETLTALLEQSGLEVLPGSLEEDTTLSGKELRHRRRGGLPFLHFRVLARRRTSPAPTAPANYEAIRSRLQALRSTPRLAALRRKWERWLLRIGV